MDEKKLTQDKWTAVVVWGVLTAGLLYSSNAMIAIFNSLISTIFSRLSGGFVGLFGDMPAALVFFLALILLLLLLNAWRNLVSLTFEVVVALGGKGEENLFDGFLISSTDEEDDFPKGSLPSSIIRDVAILWGLFYIIFLALPLLI